MATITTIADDFDNSTPAETTYFSVNGKEYAIDLNEEHRRELEDVLEEVAERLSKYTAVARPLGKSSAPARKSSKSPSSRSGASYDAGAVRSWAEENGYKVADRGRISADVLEAYNASKKG
ncbi:Lsr2 family protein [Micrococcus porci]|uniref:histone-like nucleoid-structuring protein Lsr2 n=1 Tax=Micrococcus porci TaxID=2856555 RepID=UPI001CCC7683|nr:Lsr2 family protein [Micrococcus porci]UBH25195.1 Lsr2 family protein [Micrococcus porci]